MASTSQSTRTSSCSGGREISSLSSVPTRETSGSANLDPRIPPDPGFPRRIHPVPGTCSANVSRAVTQVNEQYTTDSVYPIVNGRPADLRNLKTIDGTQAIVNGAFRNPTAYQLPLSVRMGARLSF